MNEPAIKAFVKAQTEMGKAVKDTPNPAFRSKYADLGAVQDACFPALNANGFAVMQPNGMDEHGEYIETAFIHESGARFSTKVYLRVGKNDMQGYGSAMTYARRYGLMNLAGIAPEDDDGNAAAKNPPPKEETKPANTPRPEPKAEERVLTRAEGEAIITQLATFTTSKDIDIYMKALASGPMAFAVNHPKVSEAVRARHAALMLPDGEPFGLPNEGRDALVSGSA